MRISNPVGNDHDNTSVPCSCRGLTDLPIVTEEQATQVGAILNQNRKRRTCTRYSRGRQYPLKGLVLAPAATT